MRSTLVCLAFAAACARVDPATPAAAFFDALSAHCGKAYEGRLVSSDAVDADFATERLVMHVRECSARELRIPLHVGADRSRTWVVTKTDTGLRLKHDHRHEDGSEDAVTGYGGDAETPGTAMRQDFPADDESINLFEREGLAASVRNVWSLEIDGATFAYELTRPGRHFRAEFDLTSPVAPPPPPWGAD